MATKRKKLEQQDLKALENELIELLAAGGELPPGAAELVDSPEFAQRLALRKQEMQAKNQALTKHVLTPIGMASLSIAATLQKMAPGVDQPALQAELPAMMEQLKNGGSSLLEETLLASILTLQTLAATLTAEAALQPDINKKQTLLHLALKSSNQLRQTVSTLAEIRNPRRTTFIRRQTNQLHLDTENQKKLEKSANKLFEGDDNASQEMDGRTEAEAVPTYSELETLGTEFRS